MFYYYTRWKFDGDDLLDSGVYHSTWESPENPEKFLGSCILDTLIEFRRFESKEEMEAFGSTRGLRASGDPTIST